LVNIQNLTVKTKQSKLNIMITITLKNGVVGIENTTDQVIILKDYDHLTGDVPFEVKTDEYGKYVENEM
jgi:hypothetical protein